jgi:hypothetical protein
VTVELSCQWGHRAIQSPCHYDQRGPCARTSLVRVLSEPALPGRVLSEGATRPKPLGLHAYCVCAACSWKTANHVNLHAAHVGGRVAQFPACCIHCSFPFLNPACIGCPACLERQYTNPREIQPYVALKLFFVLSFLSIEWLSVAAILKSIIFFVPCQAFCTLCQQPEFDDLVVCIFGCSASLRIWSTASVVCAVQG